MTLTNPQPLPDSIASPLPPVESLPSVVLAKEFQQAMLDHQLTLNYQPIINLESGLVCGFETLMRWHHPQRGHISPGIFIPVAEQSGQCSRRSKEARPKDWRLVPLKGSGSGHSTLIW